ncbi:MAG: hypothetical protein QXO51_01720 [Halobacteria archaeon]
MADLSRADPGHGLRVESSRETRLADGEPGDPRGVAYAAVEVEVSWVDARPETRPAGTSEHGGPGSRGRGVREWVDLFRFKEMVREADRRGLPVALAPGYVHRRASSPARPVFAPAAGESGGGGEAEAPKKEGGEGFDLLGLVRSLLRQERESLGPAYG